MEKVPQFNITTSLNIDLPVRLTAKVALAAGYYAYGELFRQQVDHHQIRSVMQIDPADLGQSPETLDLDQLTLRVDHCYRETDDIDLQLIRTFCTAMRGSVVILMPGFDCFGVALGILGRFIAMVNVPANTEAFPNDGNFAWGHVLAIVDKKFKRYSWRHGHELLLQALSPDSQDI